jgi:hypothetical protein
MKAEHPKRLTPLAPPGALLKRAFGIAQRLRLRDASNSDPVYLSSIRACPCLRCGMDPAHEAAHVSMNSGAHGKHNSFGKKAADRWTVPLCGACHREDKDSQHKVGELPFWNDVGINPLLVCSRLYAARDDFVKMRAIVFNAIAERESRSQIEARR